MLRNFAVDERLLNWWALTINQATLTLQVKRYAHSTIFTHLLCCYLTPLSKVLQTQTSPKMLIEVSKCKKNGACKIKKKKSKGNCWSWRESIWYNFTLLLVTFSVLIFMFQGQVSKSIQNHKCFYCKPDSICTEYAVHSPIAHYSFKID